MSILLFVHVIIAVLLITVILLQQTGTDGLSGIGGSGGGNMGMVTARSAANFLTRTTIILAILFFINAIILANLSSQKQVDLDKKINESLEKEEGATLPMAK
ncbi:Preprotein translocase subunit SecG [Candidatus Trichorickettsia mobilis]|uniref:Protein-export membrane protein SecG n=1 Tax=Candidatus Trichorickettsia mobilis TaxID=1346319 RepID=A0ABZ0UTA1_9RICK|nr:preprotein translocase subunit SecG [Candidatus Trichorickettsia mobilis]WPY01011.1 Preprotein translocase subunit SecG [Candidatus Trichorickettsia mobilis]